MERSIARSPTGFSSWTVIVFKLMIFPKVYLTNPAQFYLLLRQTLLLQIAMRVNLSSKLIRYLMK
jgi:hypothetical protein